MFDHPTVMADCCRLRLFSSIEELKRLFQCARIYRDTKGVPWKCVHLAGSTVGITPLGSASILWDANLRDEPEDQFQNRLAELQNATPEQLNIEFIRLEKKLRFGRIAERALWCIHRAVLAARSSIVAVPDAAIRTAIWGRQAHPRHWRGDLMNVMRGLQWLHVVDRSKDSSADFFGSDSALINHFGDLRGDPSDACDDSCPYRDLITHHHYQVEVGPSFLGALEQLAECAEDGSRVYQFGRKQRKGRGELTLATISKTACLVSVYLPGRIGEPDACKRLNAGQHRILQAMLREGTRAVKGAAINNDPLEVSQGDSIRNFSGQKWVMCPYLDDEHAYVGFNGNSKRKGLGYLLCTSGGWLSKAGYSVHNVDEFLDDLDRMAEILGLTVVGINRDQKWFDLKKMKLLAASPVGLGILRRVHTRIYTASDFHNRWNQLFGWESGAAKRANLQVAGVTELAFKLKQRQISLRRFAKECLDKDHSYVLRLFRRGDTRWPADLLDLGHRWVDRQPIVAGHIAAGVEHSNSSKRQRGTQPTIEIAIEYLKRGWAVIPQKTGAKCPCVKWKQFQDRLPTEDELREWFSHWPTAGIALVLGPVSGVFVIDIDGREAHEALLARLSGNEPEAPKALSGSREPFRYHLYFQHPTVVTKAKSTPWHPKLEFRGRGGVLVMPPSIHKSGNAYVWSEGRSPDDLPLAPPPSQIIDALKPSSMTSSPQSPNALEPRCTLLGIDVSGSTLRFLGGRYADGPDWNKRLFCAACDLQGRGMPMHKAEPLLLAGAAPWNHGEAELARRTISSAYSAPRSVGLT